MIICSPPFVCATALLNANAFPATVKPEADVAARRLAVLLRNAAGLAGEIDRAAAAFLAHLQRNWVPYISAARSRPELDHIAYPDGLHYTSSLHSVLYEFKAFLDLYTRLFCKLITPQGGLAGFNKDKIDGIELSGGRVAKWIKAQPTRRLPDKAVLADLVIAASREWITPAVRFRDTLGHFRDIPGFRHMHVSLTHGPESITVSDIVRPAMPDGSRLDQYSTELCERLGRFVAATIRLVPSVNAQSLEPWDRAARYLDEYAK